MLMLSVWQGNTSLVLSAGNPRHATAPGVSWSMTAWAQRKWIEWRWPSFNPEARWGHLVVERKYCGGQLQIKGDYFTKKLPFLCLLLGYSFYGLNYIVVCWGVQDLLGGPGSQD